MSQRQNNTSKEQAASKLNTVLTSQPSALDLNRLIGSKHDVFKDLLLNEEDKNYLEQAKVRMLNNPSREQLEWEIAQLHAEQTSIASVILYLWNQINLNNQSVTY